MNETILNIIFLFAAYIVASAGYKGNSFSKIKWLESIGLSLKYIFCIVILLGFNYQKIIINTSHLPLGLFIFISLIWFFSPKLIRYYGNYPSNYFKDNKNRLRFLVKFEHPSMTIKYFEVLLH